MGGTAAAEQPCNRRDANGVEPGAPLAAGVKSAVVPRFSRAINASIAPRMSSKQFGDVARREAAEADSLKKPRYDWQRSEVSTDRNFAMRLRPN